MYFARENPGLENKINTYFEEIGRVVDEKYSGMISIMLLGSMSRDEATWAGDFENAYLLSDIEFFTVYSSGFSDFRGFDEVLAAARDTAFGKEKSSLFHVDNTYVSRDGVGQLERKLLTFDATVFGRCVVGEDVVCLLPQVTIENINLRDIKDIMSHRVFSVVYYGFPLKKTGKDEEYRYCLAKNTLDLMTALLVRDGKLISGFKNRLCEIEKSELSDIYKRYFRYCLAIKYNSANEEEFTVAEMEKLFLDISLELYKTFKIPIKNRWINKKRLLRRLMGIVKRSVRTRHFVKLPYFKTLYSYAASYKAADEKLCKDNFVINGYPVFKGEDKNDV